MRPDFSVLLLTTLIGAGQGLFLAIFTAQAYALFDLLPPQDGHRFHAHGSLVAFALCAAGLAACVCCVQERPMRSQVSGTRAGGASPNASMPPLVPSYAIGANGNDGVVPAVRVQVVPFHA